MNIFVFYVIGCQQVTLLLLLSFLIFNANFAYGICSFTCCETLYVDGFFFLVFVFGLCVTFL